MMEKGHAASSLPSRALTSHSITCYLRARFIADILGLMSEVTRILTAIEEGDPRAAEELLPLVYEELRKLAAHKLTQEKPGQTLQATAMVHEAYLRLVDTTQALHWNTL